MRVGIIGGGPAGIAAAIAIKKASEKNEVYILEKQDRLGGKIPLTGNGRCNITNSTINLSDYCFDSAFEDLIGRILKTFNVDSMKNFLLDAGILTIEEAGRLYPASGKASQVRDAFEAYIYDLGIKCILESECFSIDRQPDKKLDGRFSVGYKDKNNKKSYIQADKVIIATGSPANLKRETDNNSIYLANKCGLDTNSFFPALTGYICDESFNKNLAGVRAKASVSFEDVIEPGELQFTEEGISGIPTFQLSLAIGRRIEKEKIQVTVDFLDLFSQEEIDIWKENIAKKSDSKISNILSGLVNPKVAETVLKRQGVSVDLKVGNLSDSQLDTLILELRSFSLKLVKIKPLNTSQVAIGGVLLDNFDNNLQAVDCKGLYSCGEVLDIAGRCGGYNLHFAIASGYYVGMNAIC